MSREVREQVGSGTEKLHETGGQNAAPSEDQGIEKPADDDIERGDDGIPDSAAFSDALQDVRPIASASRSRGSAGVSLCNLARYIAALTCSPPR